MVQKVYGSTSLFQIIKDIFRRFSVLFLVTISVLFILVGKADNTIINKIKSGVQAAFVPIVNVLSIPVRGVQSAGDSISELSRLRAENKKLSEEREILKEWETVARRLSEENKNLKGILNYVPPPDLKFVSARVVADVGGAFAQELIAYAGRDNGVQKGHVVLAGDGVIGRIVSTTSKTSRILLITDINSRLPVTIEGTALRAVLAGDNSPQPLLVALPLNQVPKVGDRVVTSHQSDLFPQGLPVGIVSSVTNRTIRVTPFAQSSAVSIVRIVDFRLSSVLPEQAEEDD